MRNNTHRLLQRNAMSTMKLLLLLLAVAPFSTALGTGLGKTKRIYEIEKVRCPREHLLAAAVCIIPPIEVEAQQHSSVLDLTPYRQR